MGKRKDAFTNLESTSTETDTQDNLNKDLTAADGTAKVIVPTVEELKEEIEVDKKELVSAAQTLKIDEKELELAEKGELTKTKVVEIIDEVFKGDDKDFEPQDNIKQIAGRSVEVEMFLESLDVRGTQEQLGLVVQDESEAKLTGYFNLNIDNEKAHGFFKKGSKYLIEITEL